MKACKCFGSVSLILLLVTFVVPQQSKVLFDAKQYQRETAQRDLQPARKSGNKYFVPLVITAIGCGVVDSLTTERALRRGGGVEGNPLLRGSTVRRQGIAWGARAGLLVMFLKLRRKNPQAVNVGLGGLAAWGCGAGAWNGTR